MQNFLGFIGGEENIHSNYTFIRFQNKVMLPLFGSSTLLPHYLDGVLMQEQDPECFAESLQQTQSPYTGGEALT